MPPTNIDPSTAIDIGAAPYSLTLDTNGAPNAPVAPGCIGSTSRFNSVWWKYTPTVSQPPMIGIRALADIGSNYFPSISVFTGPIGSLTQIKGACIPKTLSAPLTIPEHGNLNFITEVGETYYIQVLAPRPGPPAPLTSLLTFEAVNPYALATAASDLLILNDATPFSAAIVDAATGQVLRNRALEAAEHAAWSGNVLCLAKRDTNASGEPVTAIVLRDAQLNLILLNTSLVIANSNILWPVSTDYAGTFYILRSPGTTGPRTLVSISDTGVVGGTTWTLPGLGLQSGFSATALGISRDGTIAYYGGLGSADGTILRYNLVTSSAMSNLRGDIGSARVQRDILVMADDSILVVDRDGSLDFKVRRYSTTGTLLNTYAFASSNLSPMRIALAPDDPVSFWAMWFTPAEGVTSRFQRIRTSDGVVLVQFDLANAEADSWTADDPFNPSLSCPLLVMPEAIAPPVSTGTIVVTKTTNPPGSSQVFPFVATGLTPGAFDLMDGQSQTFLDVVAGSGYGIEETVPSGWTVSYTVSNGSPPSNITVADGETVTVAVLNQDNTPAPPSSCAVGHGDCVPNVGPPRIGA